MSLKSSHSVSPWSWIPSLYLAQGLPYVIVMTVSVIMYKRLGISNDDIAFYTSWLYLPWVIKPLWSPLVDALRTKRFWIVAMQLVIGAALAGVALTIPGPDFFRYSLAVFWLLAFSSATHDIAADGFYILALDDNQQATFVGIRSTFYRIAMITGQGALVVLAGDLETASMLGIGGNVPTAWSATIGFVAALFLAFTLYHLVALPRPQTDVGTAQARSSVLVKEFITTFVEFFRKDNIGTVLAFLLLYRLGEAQLVKMISPFMLDSVDKGGLGMTTEQVGFAYGTVGIIALAVGGILGGLAIARKGLQYWIWPMALIIHLPDAVFVVLALTQPSNVYLISAATAVEQFGYGFGFTSYMMYMIYVARGTNSTAHYALCTGIMALGMMLPGMFSGWVQAQLGYTNFFIWVLVATIPSFILARTVRVDAEFGKKKS
jgi:PAT family beta-lactamase induction signal transducer AmpG